MEYVHYNPVATDLCTYPEEYKYSSAKFYETGMDEFGIATHWLGWIKWVEMPGCKANAKKHTTTAFLVLANVFNLGSERPTKAEIS